MLLPVSMLLSAALVMVAVDGGPSDPDTPVCDGSPSFIHEELEPKEMDPENPKHGKDLEDPLQDKRRSSDLECPARGVCADEWKTVRDWYNGTRCREHRVLVHCRCPFNRECPVGDTNHLIYENEKHGQYLCENKCEVGRCGASRFRVAKEMVQFSPEMDFHNFYRVNCRCRGHMAPLTTRRGFLIRATSYIRTYFNFTEGIAATQYRCASRDPLSPEEDPCTYMNY